MRVCVCVGGCGWVRVTYNVANTLNFSHLPAEATRIALSAFLCRLSKWYRENNVPSPELVQGSTNFDHFTAASRATKSAQSRVERMLCEFRNNEPCLFACNFRIYTNIAINIVKMQLEIYFEYEYIMYKWARKAGEDYSLPCSQIEQKLRIRTVCQQRYRNY